MQPNKTALKIAARYEASLSHVQEVEHKNVRIKVYRQSLWIMDLENAGKRGKTCPKATFVQNLTMKDGDFAMLADEFVLLVKEGASFDHIVNLAKKVFLDNYMEQVRGVDVIPAGFEPIHIKTQDINLKVTLKDFSVHSVKDTDNMTTCIPAIKGNKAALPVFYRYVRDNESKVKGMTFYEMVDQIESLGIKVHQYCAMD